LGEVVRVLTGTYKPGIIYDRCKMKNHEASIVQSNVVDVALVNVYDILKYKTRLQRHETTSTSTNRIYRQITLGPTKWYCWWERRSSPGDRHVPIRTSVDSFHSQKRLLPLPLQFMVFRPFQCHITEARIPYHSNCPTHVGMWGWGKSLAKRSLPSRSRSTSRRNLVLVPQCEGLGWRCNS